MILRALIRVLSLALLLLVALPARAQVAAPFAGVRLQGSLADLQGNPLNGPITVTVRIYKTATGGTAVYQEIFQNQVLTNGALNLIVGAGLGTSSDSLVAALTPDGSDPTYERYLTMQLEGDAQELLPRRRITAGPVAAVAMNAQSLGGQPAATYVTGTQLTQQLSTVAHLGDTNTFQPAAPDATPVVVRAANGQTANLLEIRDSSGTVIASVSSGGVWFGDGSGLTGLNASALATGTVAPARGGLGFDASTATTGSMVVANGVGTWSTLPAGTNGQVLKVVGGVPTWGTDETSVGGGGGISQLTEGSGLTFSANPIVSTGTISIDTTVVPRLGSANTFATGEQRVQTGGAATKGLVVQGAASQVANLQEWQDSAGNPIASVGPSGTLTAVGFSGDGSGLTNVTAAAFSGTLAAAQGGTGADTSGATQGTILYAAGNGTFTTLPVGAPGQVLKVSGTNAPTWGTDATGGGSGVTEISQGTGITLNPGTITSTGSVAIDTTVVPRLSASNTFSGTQTLETGGNAAKGLIVKGAASQGVNLQEWQSSDGTPIASVSAGGTVTATSFIGGGAGLTGLNAGELGSGTVPSGRLTGTYGISITGTAASAGSVTGTVAVANGGTGATDPAGARTNLGVAAAGANSDITSLSGLSTPLSAAQGGTGTNLSGLGDGAILYKSGTAWVSLEPTTNGKVIKLVAGVPSWQDDAVGGSGSVTQVNTGIGLTGGPIDTTGTIAINTSVVPQLSASNTFTGTQTLQSGTPDAQALIVKAAGSQTANIQEWRNSGNGVLARVDSAGIFHGDGSSLTGVVADGLAPGTHGNIYEFTNAANQFTGDGSGLTSLNADNLSSGTVPDGRLAANVCRLDAAQLFSATQTYQTAGASPGVIVQANASQSTDIQQWKSGVGTKVSWVSSAGVLSGDGSGLTGLDADALSAGTIPTGRLTGSYDINVSGTANNVTGTVAVANGGTGSTTAADARTALGAAQRGANSDITSLSGLTTALSVTQGGTGSTNAANARTALGAAQRGANSDITSLSGLTTALSVAQGGTGSTTAADARAALDAAAASHTHTFSQISDTLPDAKLTGSYTSVVTLSNASNSFTGDGSGLTSLGAANLTGTIADARLSANVAKLGSSQTFTGTQTFATAGNTSSIIVQASSGQTVALAQFKNSSGTTVSEVLSDGTLSGNGSSLTSLNASNISSGTISNGRLASSYAQAISFSNVTSATIASATISAGTISGNGSGLTTLNASNISSGTLGAGRLSGSYNVSITGKASTAGIADEAKLLQGLEGGSTTSDGCVDKSPQAPDCSACGTGSCSIGDAGKPYPDGDWVWLAVYTPPTDGELTLSVGTSLLCNQSAPAGTRIEIRLSAQEAFPPPVPTKEIDLLTVNVTVPSGREGFYLLPFNPDQLIVQTTTTASGLNKGVTYGFFLRVTAGASVIKNNCVFVEAPVSLSFKPAKIVNISPGGG